MIGQKFNRLTVVEGAGSDKHRNRNWRCECDCGNVVYACTSRIKCGKVKSCGCLKSDLLRERWAKYREPAFWLRVDKSGECWEWTASTDSGGYGQLGWEGKLEKAHRVSWRLAHGPIPKGMCVLHTCDNVLCVNPAHLWLGTHADNMHDMAVKGRRKKLKLTPEEIAEMRRLYTTGKYLQAHLAYEYDISQGMVSKIVRGLCHA